MSASYPVIDLTETSDGILLPVKAQPRARKDGVTGEHGGKLKIAVVEVPEKGKANEALIRVLAEALGLRPSQVAVASGAGSRDKTLLIGGIGLDDLRERIARLLA